MHTGSKYNFKDRFSKNEDGLTILGNAADMARWVELEFEEQKHNQTEIYKLQGPFIDLCNCFLYISYRINNQDVKSRLFNLCDFAGTVQCTSKKELPSSDYYYVVDKPIRFDNSVLYGAFFHYVRYN